MSRYRRLLLVTWLLGGPAIVQAQTPPTESDLLARIAAQPQQVANYLELAKLYDQARRFDDELAILRRAIEAVRAQQGIISFTPAAPGQTGDEPIRVGGGMRVPTIVKRVEPLYPEAARAAAVSGVVLLDVVTTRDGSVRDVKVLNGDPLLAQAAVDAVKQWRFTPTLLNGRPVELIFSIAVQFNPR